MDCAGGFFIDFADQIIGERTAFLLPAPGAHMSPLFVQDRRFDNSNPVMEQHGPYATRASSHLTSILRRMRQMFYMRRFQSI